LPFQLEYELLSKQANLLKNLNNPTMLLPLGLAGFTITPLHNDNKSNQTASYITMHHQTISNEGIQNQEG